MIDLNDFSYKQTTRHGKPVNNKVYRHFCNSCGADKGYLQKSHNTPACNKCSKVGTKASEYAKKRMSEAAFKRYNDPTWTPQQEGPGYQGRKVRKHETNTDKESNEPEEVKEETIKLVKNSINITAEKKVNANNEVKIVLSFA